MPKINDLTNRPGGLQLTDEIWVADGATADFKINANNILSFIAANLSTNQLNALLETEVSCRVALNGSVNNINGRVPITGAQVSNGIYTLTCPVGYEWHTAVGCGENLEERRLVDVSRDNSNRRILHVNVRTAGGSLISVSHMVRGTLVRVP